MFQTQSSFYDVDSSPKQLDAENIKQLTAKSPKLNLQKTFILEVRLGSKYASIVLLILDRYGQLNKFEKKNKMKFRDIQ